MTIATATSDGFTLPNGRRRIAIDLSSPEDGPWPPLSPVEIMIVLLRSPDVVDDSGHESQRPCWRTGRPTRRTRAVARGRPDDDPTRAHGERQSAAATPSGPWNVR